MVSSPAFTAPSVYSDKSQRKLCLLEKKRMVVAEKSLSKFLGFSHRSGGRKEDREKGTLTFPPPPFSLCLWWQEPDI